MNQHAERRDRLRHLLSKTEADSLLVTNFTNVTYLTGFTGDDSFLLLTPTAAIILSDGRYVQQLGEECPDLDTEIRWPGTEMIELVLKVIRAAKPPKLAVEAASMTVGFCTKLNQELPQVTILAAENLVEQLREVKDQEEIDQIRASIDLAERAFTMVRASLCGDHTEKRIANELEYQIRLLGGRGCSFTPIVGVGPRGALPHARLSDHRLEESDFVLIDWGARSELYVSDLTRILVTARISPKLERIYGVVSMAQQAAIDAIRPGAVMKDVDAAARKVIEDAGFGSQFTHGLGHGIGLDIHESPRLASNQDGKLKAGMVVTVEPGIYVQDWGGVRIEDDVLVTRAGHEVLTKFPKELNDCVLQ
jgi:Xaa-Pro aminopeptidase